MKEKIKIVSDGCTTEVYINGKIVKGVAGVTFKHQVDEVAQFELQLIVSGIEDETAQ